LHFVANSPWSDEQVLAKVREMVVPQIERHGPIEVWIIDDTSFPKQGKHSVGVHHRYCGRLGKQANCQVAVTLSIANDHASLPIAYRLYLPRDWAKSAARRKKAHAPAAIKFKTKPQIALEQIGAARAARVHGSNRKLRSGVSALGLGAQAGGAGAAHERQALGAEPAETCLAHDHMVRRQQRAATLALCPRAGAHRPDQGCRGTSKRRC
jgi:hypothetical protein